MESLGLLQLNQRATAVAAAAMPAAGVEALEDNEAAQPAQRRRFDSSTFNRAPATPTEPKSLNPTCDPKPYRIVGYDPLIRGSNP